MKKLLAIVMVVAMMFSMSVVASADASADIVYADGVATITVYDAEISTVDFGVVYPEGVTCTKATWAAGWKDATATPIEDGDYTVSGIGNKAATDAAGNTYAVYTAACMQADGSPIAYDGDLLTFVFECAEGTEFKVVTGTAANGADVTAATIATLVAEAPAPVVTDTPAPVVTDTPAPQPTDDNNGGEVEPQPTEDDKKDEVEPQPTEDDKKEEVKATEKPADAGKTEAPKTADVAPVATMITLVVVAGLAIVALKKKATN